MSDEFVQSDCRKSLLMLVARGSAILAEMQRLSQHVPKIFQSPGKKYNKIIYDFSYFTNMNNIENQIESSMELLELNENIKSTYLPLLDKFYRLFQSILTYYESLQSFIKEIQTGVFMEFSLENMFQIVEGKQLISEAFYLFGVMLLLMDRVLEGPIRERIIVCYYRNKGGENISRIEDVRRLCRDRGFRVEQETNHELARPENYPQELFQLFPLDKDVLDSIIIAIKDDDIYKQMPAYPQASLRSFALSNQASIIFVLLFMRKQILYKAKSTMREIVDKHFYNMWVIPFYLGEVVDLTYWWKPYKAAKMALSNILDLESIEEMSNQFGIKIVQCQTKCKQFLTEGVMTDEFVLEKLGNLMNCVRETNVTLRWLILHRKTNHKELKEYVINSSNPVDILKTLLVCAQFQSILKERVQSLLAKKESIWLEDRDGCVQRMNELAEYFGSEKVLAKIQSDDSFKNWFTEISDVIESIGYNNATYASRKIQQVISSLQDIQQYHQISSSIQIKQYLFDTRKDLEHMIKVVNIKKTTLSFIEVISDITWGWVTLKDYIKYIQKQIRTDPDIALLLKNTFMKMSSILNTPMVRIIEAESPDMESVSNYYSNQLIKVVKDVLQVIPRLVFQLLGYIVNIFQEKIQTQPMRFDKAELPTYAQFSDRLEIAMYNHEISVFAKSILNMESYLLGVIEVNPREILENGIRKELIRLIAKILEESLTVECTNSGSFYKKIVKLSEKLRVFKMSLEYVQDFVHVYGLKMFYEEFEKLIFSYVDMDRAASILGEVGFEQLNYDQDIPLPTLKDQEYNTFMGYILREIIELTNSRSSTFILTAYGFYNCESGKEIINLKTMNILHKCIGVSGLQGLDYLLSIKIMKSIEKLTRLFKKSVEDENIQKVLIRSFNELRSAEAFSNRFDHTLSTLRKHFKLIGSSATTEFMKVGHYMLLRDMICLELRLLGKVGSPRLFLVLENLNTSLLNDMIKKQNNPVEGQSNTENQSLLMALVNPYFKHFGMLEPMKKIFITSRPIDHLPLVLFTIISSNIGEIDYDNHLKSLIRTNKKDKFQPNYFLVGILCFLQQFHPSNKQNLFIYLASYIRSTVNFIMTHKEINKNPEPIASLFTYIRFFEEAIKYSREPYEKYKGIIDLGLYSSLDKETFRAASK